MATNDKDIMQLVREGVSIYSTAKANTGSGNGGFTLLGIPEVRAKWGVDPSLIADVLALTGDSVDNIPGVPGVGGKTAAKWINQYGSLTQLLNARDIDPKVHEKVEASRKLIEANREMVALDLNLPLPLPIERMTLSPRYPELIASLKQCGFRSLTVEVEEEAARGSKAQTGNSSMLIENADDRISGITKNQSSTTFAEPTTAQGELF